MNHAPWAPVDESIEFPDEESQAIFATAADEDSIRRCLESHYPKGMERTFSAKLQAREAFQVFLENILARLKISPHSSKQKVDRDFLQQQILVLERFLRQATDLEIGGDFPNADFNVCEDVTVLAAKLSEFIKNYKRQTEIYKKECLKNDINRKGATAQVSQTTVNHTAKSSRNFKTGNILSRSRECSIESNATPSLSSQVSGSTTATLRDGDHARLSSKVAAEAVLLRHVRNHWGNVASTASSVSRDNTLKSAFPSYSWDARLLSAPLTHKVATTTAKTLHKHRNKPTQPSVQTSGGFDLTIMGEKLR
ncbi:hypothetical protein HDU83_002575 [Entophlyctis luteolus]|nr:hypothetical protein HDU83_002575 [Entophlyctis luteolus]KAJ3386015.1 hypothetical protein HDU84_001844 [Entophlyctis sp. JEL0112]